MEPFHTLCLFFSWLTKKGRDTLISPRAGWLFADSCLCGRLGGKDPFRFFFVVCRDSQCVNEAAAYNWIEGVRIREVAFNP